MALYSGENLHNIVARQKCFKAKDYSQALRDGFLSTDRAILEDANYQQEQSGCTATTAIVTGNKICVANAGDSRTVLGVKGIAKPLSFDHKPQNEGERSRICAAGGFVEVGRVNGNLALSRAIGDFGFKKSVELPPEEQIVTAYPDVMEHAITPDDEFLILACDGIWDCMHSQVVVEFIRRGIAEGQELSSICENLMDNCLAPTSDLSGIGCDNMTIMVIGLLNGQTKEQWYDMIAKRVANGEGPVAPVSSAEMIGNRFSDNTSNKNSNHTTNISNQTNRPGFYQNGILNLNEMKMKKDNNEEEEDDDDVDDIINSRTGGGGNGMSMGPTISLQQLLGHTAQLLGSHGSYVLETDEATNHLISSMGWSINQHSGNASPPPEQADNERVHNDDDNDQDKQRIEEVSDMDRS